MVRVPYDPPTPCRVTSDGRRRKNRGIDIGWAGNGANGTLLWPLALICRLNPCPQPFYFSKRSGAHETLPCPIDTPPMRIQHTAHRRR